jgi:perosamine synthetase
MIPYGKQFIDDADIEAVVEVLRSDWLTTGPKVDEFEKAIADYVGTKHAVALSNGTAALHAAMYALDIGPEDEVIVPAMTFAATANCVMYQGGKPVFADVMADSLLINPEDVEQKITDKTKAIIAVDYAGQPCDYDSLKIISNKYKIALISDACHALGAYYKANIVGSIADLTVFSFHPVKHITTGEGGMVTTNNPGLAKRIKRFRNHGIDTDHRQRESSSTWHYKMIDLGFNYRITDIQCALGVSQLRKLPEFLKRRRKIAKIYDTAFVSNAVVHPLKVEPNVNHAYHLYVVSVDFDKIGKTRKEIFEKLHNKGIGVNVHYIPVHLHPFYKAKLGTKEGDCPIAEMMYERILSLPIYPHMIKNQIDEVIKNTFEAIIK